MAQKTGELLRELSEALGEYVVAVKDRDERDEFPVELIEAMQEKLGAMSRVVEWVVVVLPRKNGDLVVRELRARVAKAALAEALPRDLRGVLEVMSADKLKDHLKGVHAEVSEVVALKRRIRNLESRLRESEDHRRTVMHPWMPWMGRF